ncbi:flagellin [bacterium]|jgi:flagellin|nr:flagellin [bacterium]
MTSINAGGAFYRVQNSLNQNSEEVSKSMQRLASGKQNIAPGDRTGSSAVAWGMKAEAASLKIGMQNGTEALQAVEMVNNDLQSLNEIVVRLEELHALGTNGFNTAEDIAALDGEATALLTEMSRITTSAKWKGNAIIGATANANDVSFGRNTSALDIKLGSFSLPTNTSGANTITNLATFADKIAAGDTSSSDGADAMLLELKTSVDTLSINAGALYNQISNTLSHLGSLNAGYSLDVASKMDVDFAGETTELAKGQILAQAGTAMLAQANAQGQGMLALIQS